MSFLASYATGWLNKGYTRRALSLGRLFSAGDLYETPMWIAS